MSYLWQLETSIQVKVAYLLASICSCLGVIFDKVVENMDCSWSILKYISCTVYKVKFQRYKLDTLKRKPMLRNS